MPFEFTHILFDLDGTVTRSDAGVIGCVEYALKKMGRPSLERAVLLEFIGPPLEQSFRTICGFEKADADRAIALYRERYSAIGIYEGYLYEGIPALLAELAAAGRCLHIATSKPLIFARQILTFLGVAEFFTSLHGSSLSNNNQTKAHIIAETLAEENINPDVAVMVGDRCYDIVGARENKIATIGVLYGYGNSAEMEQFQADWVVPDVESLGRLLMSSALPGREQL